MSSINDPVAELMNQVLSRGWVIMPHLTVNRLVEHMLVRGQGPVTDLVTLLADGLGQVARLDGAFDRHHPLQVPVVRWLHHVPLDLALSWALDKATDNDLALAANTTWVDPPLFATLWQRGLWADHHDISDHD